MRWHVPCKHSEEILCERVVFPNDALCRSRLEIWSRRAWARQRDVREFLNLVRPLAIPGGEGRRPPPILLRKGGAGEHCC